MTTVKLPAGSAELNATELQDALHIFTYWGLRYDEVGQTFIPYFDQLPVNIHSADPGLIDLIAEALAHTGLAIESAVSQKYDFVILTDSINEQFEVKKNNQTYHMKTSEHSGNLQTQIYKGIWLSDYTDSQRIVSSGAVEAKTAEWCSYLILQQLIEETDLLPISHIPLSRYLSIVEKTGHLINRTFAEKQKFDADHLLWPHSPFSDAEPASSKKPKKKPDKNDQLFKPSGQPANTEIKPFSQNTSDPKPFNPFKNNT